MSLAYRKPGVYVEERLLVGGLDIGSSTSVALFVGVAGTGPTDRPVLCGSWSDYVAAFGSFDPLTDPNDDTVKWTTYLPYAVYSYFQNGGKPAYVQRAVASSNDGEVASYDVLNGTNKEATISKTEIDTNVGIITTSSAHGFSVGETVVLSGITTATYLNGTYEILTTPSATKFTVAKTHVDSAEASDAGTATVYALTSFTVSAANVGAAGNNLGLVVKIVDEVNGVFNLSVYNNSTEIERFSELTVTGDTPGTRKVDDAVNDPYSGSALIRISGLTSATPAELLTITALSGGTDPALPDVTDFPTITSAAAEKIDVPLIVNQVGFTSDPSDPDAFQAPVGVASGSFAGRGDVFVINDSVPKRPANQSAALYKAAIGSTLKQFTGDSYVASYTPWIITPDPTRPGSTITIPPGGAVAGVMSRIDSTIGVFRAPAGVVAGITNAVGVDTKFTDSDLGDLNEDNINVIRPLQGVGVAVMGARTRKPYAVDKYVSARRTLIYIKESLKRSTQYALFENNDQRLWSSLIMTAERLLRPLWEQGGLKGDNSTEAYYIKCDGTINTPTLIQSGEVRMEIGVALEYPAEFIVIRVTQIESGGIAFEVQPNG